jgi:hypothetical protein
MVYGVFFIVIFVLLRTLFLKGIYWSDSLYIKQGVYKQLFLVPIAKNIQFLLYHELQIGIMGTAQKTVGAVKIYCTNEKKHCCRWLEHLNSLGIRTD